VVAGIAVAVFAASGVVAVNAGFGINPTLGGLFGVVPADTIALPPSDAGDDPPDQPLYETWHAPADMPATGRVGTAEIPATVSGFDARPAGIYLPPAALVADAPALPVIVFMMGQPGNPDPSFLAATLDAYAAQHDGLAPIAVVADQVGANVVDTACADSTAYGNAETYITKDVVTWVKAHLHVIDDPRWWVIGGYSNGGGCAITFAAEHPELWKNVMDISGEPYPGSEQPDNIEKTVYGGSTQAFEASKPVNILAAHPGAYDGMTAAFTAGGDDPTYVTAAQTVSAAAQRAGMSVSLDIIPGAGHTGNALTSGLQITVGKMYPALGLSPG
jgi:enterochelin esterase-like enzyme